MFIKDMTKFEKNVEKTIYSFFKMKPEDLEIHIKDIKEKYGSMYDLDNVPFQNVRPDVRDSVLLYRTMSYFFNIYKKLKELKYSVLDAKITDAWSVL